MAIAPTRTKVGPHSASKQRRVLRDDGDAGTQLRQAQLADILAINDDLPLHFDEPAQRREPRDTRLAHTHTPRTGTST